MRKNKKITLPSMAEVLQFYRNSAQSSAASAAQAAAMPLLPLCVDTGTFNGKHETGVHVLATHCNSDPG
jgi:hypothetical protein